MKVKTRILLILYKKHYSGQPGHPQLTSDVIKEADLSHHDIPFVKGEIAHLVQTGLVQGANYLTAPNYTLSISGMGINEVKKWIMKFNTFLQVESGTDYKQISAIESETAKLGEIWEYSIPIIIYEKNSLRIMKARKRLIQSSIAACNNIFQTYFLMSAGSEYQ